MKDKSKLTIADVPGFVDAWTKAESDLNEAMLMPFASNRQFTVCGIAYNQLTLQMVADLELSGNELFTQGKATDEIPYRQIGYRMWEYYNEKTVKEFIAEFEKTESQQRETLRKYLTDISSIPSKRIGKKGKETENKVCWFAYIVNTFASAYSWGYNEIMNTPISTIHQLINAMRERNEKDFKPEPRHRNLKRAAMIELRKMKGEI